MEALNCKNCGGQIDPRTHKCRYCGTYYKDNLTMPMPKIVTLDRSGAKEIVGRIVIPMEALQYRDVGALQKMAKSEIVMQLAEAMEPYAEWEVQDDIATLETVVRGRVRILPPRR